jgi:hypothetical protein
MLPADYLSLLRRIDVLETKVARLATRPAPNQSLSTGSSVSFLRMLVGDRGTWVPVFAGSTAPGAFTYTNQQGYYYVVSNMIFLFGRITISGIGSAPTGTMRITGLPYPCNATYFGVINFGHIHNFNYTAAALDLTGLVPLTQYIDLRESFDNSASVLVPAANFTNAATDLVFTGIYPGA